MARLTSNYAQTSGKILLDLINNDNSTSLAQSAITFGAPTVVAEDNASGLITEIVATEADTNTPVTITAKATSLVWAKAVTINVTKPLVALSSVLTQTTLDGLYPPAAV